MRDRFGEKSLYYGYIGKDLAFTSEPKSLRVLPGFVGDLYREAVAGLCARSYTAPTTSRIVLSPPRNWRSKVTRLARSADSNSPPITFSRASSASRRPLTESAPSTDPNERSVLTAAGCLKDVGGDTQPTKGGSKGDGADQVARAFA